MPSSGKTSIYQVWRYVKMTPRSDGQRERAPLVPPLSAFSMSRGNGEKKRFSLMTQTERNSVGMAHTRAAAVQLRDRQCVSHRNGRHSRQKEDTPKGYPQFERRFYIMTLRSGRQRKTGRGRGLATRADRRAERRSEMFREIERRKRSPLRNITPR